ncbi:VQ motif-containing protein [Carex littledalei]|uniref:VQ motif-containing protein n=1 Tax=Carex littledalei TaxID=544730 RepID=A0A833QU84_9POAL|nr:VQ motif-containing protein [Carex littledalei]
MCADSREQDKKVKVTFIELETMFVETDAENFMLVVQKLTGKEKEPSPSEANKENAMPIKPQEEVCIANGGFMLEAPCAKDAVDEVVAWMAELEPHLDELYDIMNQ